MPFSFLHISDIHFDTESTSSWISRNEILREIQDENLKADCEGCHDYSCTNNPAHYRKKETDQ